MTSVLIYDEHCGWSPSLNASKGTGGTEVHLVQIATWLASQGITVRAACHNAGNRDEEGVFYTESRHPANLYEGMYDAIITVRKSRIPPVGLYDVRDPVLTLVTDDPRPCPHDWDHLLGRSTLVCVSEWQAGLYRELGHRCVVIPPPIDAEYEEFWGEMHMFGCYSAWNKGTQATLDAWSEMGRGAPLRVGSPYGAPHDAKERCAAVPGAEWIGELKPADVVRELNRTYMHVRVCTIAETFGATDAIAEAVSCTPYVYCPNEVGALQSTLAHKVFLNRDDWTMAIRSGAQIRALPDRDFRTQTVMPKWLKLLNGDVE